MRICMLLDRYLPVIGGAEVLASHLSQTLIASGHQVEVITRRLYRDLPARDVVEGVPVRRLSPVGLSRLANALMVFRMMAFLLMEGGRYDVWHVHGVGPIGLAALLIGPLRRRPVFLTPLAYGNLTRRDPSGIIPPAYTRLVRRFLLPAWLWNRILQRAAGIGVISAQIGAEAEALGLGAKTMVIPNGVDLSLFHPVSADQKRQIAEQLSLPTEHPLLLFVGRLVALKRPEVLIDALPLLLERHPDCHVLLAGSGSLQVDSVEEALRTRVETLGVSSHVTFLGAVTNMAAYYQAADVFVFPSEQEGLPVAVLEAMASGLPIVASRIAGVTDLVDDDTAWLVPVGDSDALAEAVADALAHPDLAARRGEAVCARAEADYSIGAIAEAYLRLYARR